MSATIRISDENYKLMKKAALANNKTETEQIIYWVMLGQQASKFLTDEEVKLALTGQVDLIVVPIK